MTTSATGDKAKQTGLSKKLAPTKPNAALTHKITAPARLIWPVGKCRAAVRGLRASNLRSTIRLKAIAHVRAQTMAARMKRKVRQPGQPRLARAATSMAASVKG